MPCRVLGSGKYQITCSYSPSHRAVDMISGSGGTDYIVAHSQGTVVMCQTGIPNAKGSSGNRSYGNFVILSHQGGYQTLYAHMDWVEVKMGQSVGKNQRIGYMGNTGNSYGAHLHFEVRSPDGSRIEPLGYILGDLPGLKGGGSTSGGSSSGGGSSGSGSKGSSSKEQKPAQVEITQVKLSSVQGSEGKRDADALMGKKLLNQGVEILVQNGSKIYMPAVISAGLEWSRKGAPGSLSFECIMDKELNIREGNPVSLRYNGKNVFYGYIFEKSESEPFKLSVSCYDQLRYLKNKTSMAHSGKSYSQLLKEIAAKYQLKCGSVESTGFKMGRKLEEGTLFDILGDASDETVMKTGKLYVLYDDFGKLCLKNIQSMFVPIMIDESAAGQYKYSSSIDKDVYTKIVLAKDDDTGGVRELYVANNQQAQKDWGILEYYEAQNDMTAAQLRESAKLLMNYYGKKRRSLSLQKCFGDIRVRGGSSVVVYLKTNDKSIRNIMVVEKVKHSFEPGIHTMDLDLSGINGEFVV